MTNNLENGKAPLGRYNWVQMGMRNANYSTRMIRLPISAAKELGQVARARS